MAVPVVTVTIRRLQRWKVTVQSSSGCVIRQRFDKGFLLFQSEDADFLLFQLGKNDSRHRILGKDAVDDCLLTGKMKNGVGLSHCGGSLSRSH